MPIDPLYYGNNNKQTGGGEGAIQSFGEKRLAATLGLMDTIIANTFIRTLAVAHEPPKGTDMQAQGHEKKSDIPANSIFKTGTELMYRGQGKVTSIEHFAEEIKEKLRTNQACLVPWDDINDNPPPQLKISPIAAIPHKSKAFRSILDLSFHL